ncbi:MAG TPA: cytochrome c [Longimicrobiaceae bacterium]|nr:cytochrome c [Longimicrobiaceae bacterium]
MRIWKFMVAAGIAAAALLAECHRAGSGRREPAVASGGEGGARSPRAAAEDSTPAGLLYRRACIMCHGEAGRGTQLGPSLADAEWRRARGGAPEAVAAVVAAGVPDPDDFPVPMPARGDGGFGDDEVRAVSSYVAALAAAPSP